MLDINLFRVEKGSNPDLIRDSQRCRFSDVDLVDKVMEFDEDWIKREFQLGKLKKDYNAADREFSKLKRKSPEVHEAKERRDSSLEKIGHIVHHTVPTSNNEDDNLVVRSWREKRTEPDLQNHADLVELLGIAEFTKGGEVAGRRGVYLDGSNTSNIYLSVVSWLDVRVRMAMDVFDGSEEVRDSSTNSVLKF